MKLEFFVILFMISIVSAIGINSSVLLTVTGGCDTYNHSINLTTDETISGTCIVVNASNIVINCAGHTITGDGTGYGVYNNGYDNVTIKNCIIQNFSIGIYLNDSVNNVVRNNTLNQSQDLLIFANNSNIYYNKFFDGTNYYINNSGTTNTFNTTSSGVAQGNYYDDINTIFIFDTNNDGWGNAGTDYPYDSGESKWLGSGADYGPMNARVDTTGPNCSLISITPNDIEANSTGPFEILINCTDVAGINVSTFVFTRTVEGFDSPGIPNYWSIRPPSNNKSQNFTDTHGHDMGNILKADGRNDGKAFEDWGIFSDYYTYAASDSSSPKMTITNNNVWAILNFSWNVEPIAFRSNVFLSRGKIEKEYKKEYEIYKNHPLLVKYWDLQAMRNITNYTVVAFRNINYSGNPNKLLNVYYCNESYNITGGTSPKEDLTNCVYLNSFDKTDLNTIYYSSRNSSYSKSEYGIINHSIGGIVATNIFYVYYTSETSSGAGKYLVRYANGSSGTNVSFNETKVAWSSDDDGNTFTQENFTPDNWFSAISNGDECQFGLYIEDNVGNNLTNFSFVLDEIGDVNHPITHPIIKYYCQGSNEACIGGKNWDLNGTYHNIISIHIGVAKDADSIGSVNHSLYLCNVDGSINYTINNSFYSVDDSDLYINFNTNLVPNGVYKMNITAVADDDPTDIQSYLTEENFTIESCGIINENITLMHNITVNGSCFVANMSNIILDCANYMLSGNGTGYGFVSNGFDNITIHNCTFNSFDVGVIFNETTINSNIINSTFNQSKNLLLENLTENNLIYYNVFYDGINYYINNSGTNNTFNRNYYEDIRHYYIFDENDDGYGDTGKDYPYNSEQLRWIGSGEDYNPIMGEEIANITYGDNISGMWFTFHIIDKHYIPHYNISVINQTDTNPFLNINNSNNITLIMRINTTLDPSIMRIKCSDTNMAENATILNTSYINIVNTTNDTQIWCWMDVLNSTVVTGFDLNWFIQTILR